MILRQVLGTGDSRVEEGSFICSKPSRNLKYREERGSEVVQLENLPRVSSVHNLRKFRKKEKQK